MKETKKEIRARVKEFIDCNNTTCTKKITSMKFLTNDYGTEYLLLNTEFDTLFYGFIENFTARVGLKFYGVATFDNKIQLLFFRGEGMKI